MRQAVKQKESKPSNGHISKRLREGLLIIASAIALFLVLALMTYHRSDPGWSSTGTVNHVANSGGRAGAWFADVFLYLFGYLAYIIPIMMAYSAWAFMRVAYKDEEHAAFDARIFALRLGGFVLLILAGTGLASLQFSEFHAHVPFSAGGILGNVIASHFTNTFNVIGATLILIALFCTGLTISTGLSWLGLMDSIGGSCLAVLSWFMSKLGQGAGALQEKHADRKAEKLEIREALKADKKARKIEAKLAKQQAKEEALRQKEEAERLKAQAAFEREQAKQQEQARKPTIIQNPKPAPAIEAAKPKVIPSARAQKAKQEPLFKNLPDGPLPSFALLDPAEDQTGKGYSEAQLESMSREVEERLKEFGVSVKVVAVQPGPVITRFEMELAPGLKVSRISGLAKDLARSLSMTSVRIVEVIPGKTTVGLELPNENREMVRLSEVLSSQQYESMRSPLALSLGKDISGNPVVVDLAKMPHLLVAGTTGSGKSVGVNAMILGMLYKATPEQVRMILVDPKMLELSIYEGIPHLLTPVVTDMKEAANGLRWCVGEMERRYRLMAAMGVRNLAGFNKKIKDAIDKDAAIPDPLWQGEEGDCPTLEPLPFIVVVIDEFADMMMVVGKKVEQLIARIAQKARAAGIHLILATQRPSVDVITGLIKANVPTRMAFQVSSKIDSRTILDQGGAEQLLGQGDMLYLPPGTSVPIRVHGAFVADHEVHKTVEDWKQRGTPQYLEEILSSGGDGGATDDIFGGGSGGDEGSEKDALYDEAVYFVTKSRKASISSVQRRLKIGYNRAARMIEEMEEAGVVSPMESNGSREVLAPPPPE